MIDFSQWVFNTSDDLTGIKEALDKVSISAAETVIKEIEKDNFLFVSPHYVFDDNKPDGLYVCMYGLDFCFSTGPKSLLEVVIDDCAEDAEQAKYTSFHLRKCADELDRIARDYT